jgi:heme oxygenase
MESPETADLPALLREATARSHEAIGEVPFFRELGAGRLTRQAALNYLRGLATVHEALEERLAADSTPRGLWSADMARLPDLRRDLRAAGADGAPEDPSSAAAARSLAAAIRRDASRPLGLIGYLYVLEGSQMGGQGLRKLFAAALGLPQDGFTYYSGDGKATVARWQALKKGLSAVHPSPADAAEIARTAVAAFDGVAALARAALPSEPAR